MVLNPEQCRAKAAQCLDAAHGALYVDQQRLYEEIAEQWLLIAQQIEQGSAMPSGNGSATKHVK